MTETIDEMMSFNPQDLSAFNTEVTNNYDQHVYKTNPKDSKSDSGHYVSKIRVIYNPFDLKQSIVPQTTYALNDADGFFMVRSMLANGDRNCPLFKSWKKLWFSHDEAKKEWARKMYDKNESQWVLIQVLEDDNKPELKGKIMVMKLPKAIYAKMVSKMNPTAEAKKAPVPIMDYLIGLPLMMDVIPGPDDPKAPERKNREISYDVCEFDTDYAPITKVDGTPLFDDTELEIIDAYVTARADVAKAKTDAKRKAAEEALAKATTDVTPLYQKAMEYLKENSLDLVEECGYQEWTPEVAARVAKWIEIVAKMEDPKTYVAEEIPTVVQEVANAPVANTPAETPTDDGLPF